MEQSARSNNQFVIDLLTTLRQERFSLDGWRRFFARSWAMPCTTARANPSLKRSWLRMTLLIILLAVAMLIATFAFEGQPSHYDCCRALPSALRGSRPISSGAWV